MMPCFGDPVNDFDELIIAYVPFYFSLNQFPSQVSAQETFNRFCVISTQHPPG